MEVVIAIFLFLWGPSFANALYPDTHKPLQKPPPLLEPAVPHRGEP